MFCGIATAVLFTGTLAFAQLPAPTGDEDTGIAAIVVAAQRREETAQRAALAVDIVSATSSKGRG